MLLSTSVSGPLGLTFDLLLLPPDLPALVDDEEAAGHDEHGGDDAQHEAPSGFQETEISGITGSSTSTDPEPPPAQVGRDRDAEGLSSCAPSLMGGRISMIAGLATERGELREY